MLKRLHFEDRESWLAGREAHHGIGGSEAAAAIGMSPWQTPIDLWKLKTGQATPKDLSGNAAIQQGVKWEPILRDFFSASHDEYTVEHYPYDILYQAETPFVFATLDGELLEADTGRHGILEIKTATPNGKGGWAKWSNGQMPQNYFCQVLHQLLATGFDFVCLYAALYSQNGDITLREYKVDRNEVAEDMAWLLEQETTFWRKVEKCEMPAMPLIL